MNVFGTMQKMGKSLMLPVACMPAAGILLGIGGNSEVAKFLPEIVAQIMTEAGLGVFANMALLFAIGVALGFTKNDGVAALDVVIEEVKWLTWAVRLEPQGHFAKLHCKWIEIHTVDAIADDIADGLTHTAR